MRRRRSSAPKPATLHPSTPKLTRVVVDGIASWVDWELEDSAGVVVAFSERTGGVSSAPYESLNMAGHVGDRPDDVDANRSAWLVSLGLAEARERLTMAEQVHGSAIRVVEDSDAGAGARVRDGVPVPATDALLTKQPLTPLALCFADCVPVVLVAPGPVVAIVHAGWRGALASLPGETVSELCKTAGCRPQQVVAYIGAHIGACHYEVDATLLSQFVDAFGTVARADSGGLDLDAVVTASLESAGVASCNIARLGICTAEATDRFFSYRAEGGVTGRHAALACIL